MGITHEWNGTVLTITSDSGTSSADLKGAKGDTGARGIQGKPGDCVATDTVMLGGKTAGEYALKTDIPSLDGYATEDYVNTAIANADIDLSGYATKTDLEDYALTTDLEPYATAFYVDNEIDAVKTDLATNYALKGDTAPNAFMLGGKNAEEYALKTDTAVNASMLGGKAPEYYIQPRNLLDNTDFRNPVNQRGYTVYNTCGYTIDRWILYFSDWANFTIENGLVFNIGSNGCSFYQRISTKSVKVGEKYTLAYMLDGVISVQEWICEATENESYDIAIGISQGTHTLYWVALYEGSYTADTLPPYVPKGYAVELAECLRYYQVLGDKRDIILTEGNGGLTVSERFLMPMRMDNPTITATRMDWKEASDSSQNLKTSSLVISSRTKYGFIGYIVPSLISTHIVLESAYIISADL